MERRIIMKLMSWNVNGLRAALRHGFVNTFTDLDADIFAIQDTRLEPNEVQVDLPGYYQYWNYAKTVRVMLGLLCLPKKSQLPWLMVSEFQKLMEKAEALR